MSDTKKKLLNLRNLNRIQAFLSHITISLLVLAVISYFTVAVWYPSELKYAGGLKGLLLLATIYIALGPPLTLILFNTKKRWLYLDLAIITIVQTCALLFGLNTLYKEKPHLVVLSNDGVYTFTKDEIDTEALESNSSYIGLSRFNPNFFLLDLPPDEATIKTIAAIQSFSEGIPLAHRIDLYKYSASTQDLMTYRKLHTWNSDLKCLETLMYSRHLTAPREVCYILSPPRLTSLEK